MKNTKIKLLELFIKKNLSLDFLGTYKTAFKGNGLVFHDLRQYVVGDSIKSIDWKTSAKHNDIYVKNYEEERSLKVLFILDITSSMMFGSQKKNKLDLLIEVFFTLAFSATYNHDNIGIFLYNGLNTEFINFSSGEENIFKAIKRIYHLKENSINKESINIDILKKLESIKIRDSLVFMLSDKLEFDKSIFKLFGVENEFIYINIFDYFENNLGDLNTVFNFKDNFSYLNIFINDKKKKQEFINLRKSRINNFSTKLNNVGLGYIYIDTQIDIFKELFKFFIKRSIRL